MSDDPCHFGCLTCGTAGSFTGNERRMPDDCPTRTHRALTNDVSPYESDDRHALMVVADRTPFAEGRRLRNRVEELVEYAKGRGYKRIGVAFCVSLTKEAQELGRLLTAEGLEPSLVCCRVGAVDYARIGLTKNNPDKFAAICNPAAQARLLNLAGVELVAQVGLCIGHDLVLADECDAPVTTLVVKDRALDHAPLRALRPMNP